MTHITFVEASGVRRIIDAVDGLSLMEAAVHNMVHGIDGDCGGNCACATCHIHIDPAWHDKMPALGETELSLLQFAHGVDECSRLACQVRVSPALEGLVVQVPDAQH